ncbi:Crp/Fnr family transcriptional regulator [Aquisalibacillus elongatus]|uniref:CRP-like cAMP-binding protein n=1 Tax=Aquisalibacillus elongatus TaxID=485577 RepID=A0A3N5CBM7_9BACI|nr:Crp/Fnr family transcriptional regulator [Aquisalibacillus elongatus]RPF54261.1 CRP-like cAMP-binding protein [Aquisalibacillus elongatus]
MEFSKLWYLSKIGFLDGVPESASNDVVDCIQHTDYRRGEIIRTPETFRDELCFIKTGCVRIFTVNHKGKEFTYSLLGPGSTFGKMKTFSLNVQESYVQAVDDTHFCSVNEETFLKLSEKHPTLLQKALQELSFRLEEREEMLKSLALDHVRDRIIHLLQTLHNRYYEPRPNQQYHSIHFPLTQQEIANMVGSTREVVSTILRELAEEGLVRFPKRKRIDVHDSIIKEDPNPSYIRNLFIENG